MEKIIKELIEFRNIRNWEKFHTPAMLCSALSVESSELLELFLWDANPDIERISEEVADVIIYALYISNLFGLDVKQIIREKIVKNAVKYPIGQ